MSSPRLGSLPPILLLIPVAKSLSDCMSPDSVIPAYAGIHSFQSRGTRDWTLAFAGVTGREKVIVFGNCYVYL
jgi:hypothetical protein